MVSNKNSYFAMISRAFHAKICSGITPC